MNRQLVLVVTLVLLGFFNGPNEVDAEARVLKVPLHRATTMGIGSLGQPVVSYYAPVYVGTPPKPFKVQFDLETNELFLPHYSRNFFNTNLHYSNGFQCKKSSTCVKNNSEYMIEYQHVKMRGKRYMDTVILDLAYSADPTNNTNWYTPRSSKFVSWPQSFLAISSASDGRFRDLPIDGFFGLGPTGKSMTGIDGILTSLHKAGLIDNLQFSIRFNPVLDSPNGGTLILGGVDTNLYQGIIYWHQLLGIQPDKWTLGLESVRLGSQIIACSAPYRTGCQAKLSSGISDIFGPPDHVKRIYSLLNTTKSSSGLRLIDCRRIPSLPYITFNIDGIPYHILASNYIRKTENGTLFKKETCYVAILPSDYDVDTWALSTPFLGAYYSIFDMTNRQVGFAALR